MAARICLYVSSDATVRLQRSSQLSQSAKLLFHDTFKGTKKDPFQVFGDNLGGQEGAELMEDQK